MDFHDGPYEMKPIDDADIETNWAEHFPKRLVNGHSKTICTYICLIVSHKAQHETAERWSKKLRLVLRKFGVPEKEFHRLKVSASSHEEADT
jgi:type IV pilus biogenesis protein CpaD/CtpE